jgi:predicted thioesterase
MADFRIGEKFEYSVEVGNENAITFLGEARARVLSTPQMIHGMERASWKLVLPMLDPGQNTVGTHVNVSHRAAAPMGATVVFTSELLAVNERRVEFRVSCRMGEKVIGEGTHQRAIIRVSEFAERVNRQNET